MPGLTTSLLIGAVAGLAACCALLFRRAAAAASSRDEADKRAGAIQAEFEQQASQQAQRSELELNAAIAEARDVLETKNKEQASRLDEQHERNSKRSEELERRAERLERREEDLGQR